MVDDFGTNPRYAGLRARQQRNRVKVKKAPVSATSVKKPTPVSTTPKVEKEPIYHQPTTPEVKRVVEKPIYVPEPAPKAEEVQKPVVKETVVAMPSAPDNETAKPAVAPAPKAPEVEAAKPVAAPKEETKVKETAPVAPIVSKSVAEAPKEEQKAAPVSEKKEKAPVDYLHKNYRINKKRVGLIIIFAFLIFFGIGGGLYTYRLHAGFTTGHFPVQIAKDDTIKKAFMLLGLGLAAGGVLSIVDLVLVAIKGKKEAGLTCISTILSYLSLVVLLGCGGYVGYLLYTVYPTIVSHFQSGGVNALLDFDLGLAVIYIASVVLSIIATVKLTKCASDASKIDAAKKKAVLVENQAEEAKMKEEVVKATEEEKPLANAKSYFDGRLIQLIGVDLLLFFFTILSLGIAFPWLYCCKRKWVIKHTVVQGYRMGFDGRGGQLIGNWIKWFFLGIITLTIYWLWVPLKLKGWEVKHTYLIIDPKGV